MSEKQCSAVRQKFTIGTSVSSTWEGGYPHEQAESVRLLEFPRIGKEVEGQVDKMRGSLSLPLVLVTAMSAVPLAQEPRPVFTASVERVTLSATVRTGRGRPVTDLTEQDFVLMSSGRQQTITDFRRDATPVSLGFLVDFSGSMGVGARRAAARENVHHMLQFLEPGVDRAGLFVFDKTLTALQPLGPAPGDILAQLDGVQRPFGATSLFDAIAETGRTLAAGSGTRRAVVALTDGVDNASTLTAAEVSGLASSIDVPVYIIIVVSPLDADGEDPHPSLNLGKMVSGQLGDLARWTGGDIFVSLGPQQAARTARELVTELRQQYLIAFEPDSRPGWHPISLRTTRDNLVVRTRSGYFVRD
jgi:Ca-activated chloride channel family protein